MKIKQLNSSIQIGTDVEQLKTDYVANGFDRYRSLQVFDQRFRPWFDTECNQFLRKVWKTSSYLNIRPLDAKRVNWGEETNLKSCGLNRDITQ